MGTWGAVWPLAVLKFEGSGNGAKPVNPVYDPLALCVSTGVETRGPNSEPGTGPETG